MLESRQKIALAQFNNAYGAKRYLPYCAGLMISYVQSSATLRDRYEFLPFQYAPGDVSEIAETMAGAEIVGLSCYSWNWRLSLAVSADVRRRNPNALIVLGGPAVPNDPNGFFTDNPHVDYLVHSEGEITFGQILEAHDRHAPAHDIPGTSYRDRATGEVSFNARRERLKELNVVPSPYLDGVFDDLIHDAGDVEWMALWETNRGCPYACTFCEWGGADTTKLRRFEMDRLEREIDWFGRNRIGWIFSADANFGILKRDEEIAERLAEAKRAHGYPREFRVCYTKNSSERIYDIAKILDDEGMSKGVSLSMQSLNPDTLTTIKRTNISMEQFRTIQSRFLKDGMVTFTEIIIGLPGESYDSFVEGLETLLENGQHTGINIYNCSILPNAEMAEPEYRRQHGICSVEIPVFQPHAARGDREDPSIREREHVAIGTATLPVADWRRVQKFAWAVQCFHALGLLQAVALFMRHQANISYRDFYEGLVEWGHRQPKTLIGSELGRLDEILDNVIAGIGFDQYVDGFIDISWPHEEAAYLRISDQQDRFFDEVRGFADTLVRARGDEIEPRHLDALFHYQKARCKHWNAPSHSEIECAVDIHAFIDSCRLGGGTALVEQPARYRVQAAPSWQGDKLSFSREVVWFGRKGGAYLYDVETIQA